MIGSVFRPHVALVRHTVDYIGAFFLTVALAALVLITSLGGSLLAWQSLDMLCLALFALIGLVGFVLEQRRAVEPIMPLHLFRHRTFVLAGLIGFIVGVSLFGAVTFLPLYMQVVKNATPTSAGLQMLPLMGGLLVVSAITGRLISRWGRYRVFPIIGTLLQVIALGLLSRLQLDTPMALMNLYMGLLGAGLGMVMQVLILAVQNSVELRHMGVATSGATLFRSIGGAIGVSLFGALFSHSLLGGLGSDFAASAGGAASLSPAAVHALPTALQHSYLQAFSGATHGVFLLAGVITSVAFALSWLLREVPLRKATQA
ncbi:Multidrug resistance protein 3 [compost metagenome]